MLHRRSWLIELNLKLVLTDLKQQGFRMFKCRYLARWYLRAFDRIHAFSSLCPKNKVWFLFVDKKLYWDFEEFLLLLSTKWPAVHIVFPFHVIYVTINLKCNENHDAAASYQIFKLLNLPAIRVFHEKFNMPYGTRFNLDTKLHIIHKDIIDAINRQDRRIERSVSTLKDIFSKVEQKIEELSDLASKSENPGSIHLVLQQRLVM